MSSFFKVGSNMRERCVLNESGNRVDILYSYETPVATIHKAGHLGEQVHVTTTNHSATTTRHINKWLIGRGHGKTTRNDLSQDHLWDLHHYANATEAKKAGVTV